MNKAKVIESLEKVDEGIQSLITALKEDCNCSNTDKDTVTPNNKSAKSSEVVEAPKESVELTRDVLEQMSYNDIKKLCKENGIKAVGSAPQLIEKLLSTVSEVEAEEEPEEPEQSEEPEVTEEDVAPVKEVKSTKSKKSEDDDLDEDLLETIKSEAEGMTEEDILDILADVGISPKGKKTKANLIKELAKAVRDGLIAIDDEDEEDEEEQTSAKIIEPDFNNSTEEEEDDESEEEDDEEEEITEARAKAIEELKESYATMVEDGELTVDEMAEFIEDFYGEYPEDLSDEEVFEVYCNTVAKLIDDDGELHEEGAYAINGEFYCCGKPLKYAEETNKFICESCGAEYEAE